VPDGAFNIVNVIYTGIIDAPTSFAGCKLANIFLSQTEFANHLTWVAPTTGNPPVTYSIYSNAGLTDLVASVPATVLQYDVQSINPKLTYTYYIVSVDSSGNTSSPAIAVVSANC